MRARRPQPSDPLAASLLAAGYVKVSLSALLERSKNAHSFVDAAEREGMIRAIAEVVYDRGTGRRPESVVWAGAQLPPHLELRFETVVLRGSPLVGVQLVDGCAFMPEWVLIANRAYVCFSEKLFLRLREDAELQRAVVSAWMLGADDTVNTVGSRAVQDLLEGYL